MSARQAGYSLAEALVTLALAAVVSVAALQIVQTQSRVARRTADATERQDALRTAAQVLSSETRWLSDRDVRAAGKDSLGIRVVRGVGIACGAGIIRYRGLRHPDPAKDSVLIVRDTAFEAPAAVSSAAPADGCAARNEESWVVGIDRPVRPGDVLIFFESGTYYLSGGALRYRLGAEGRQPVTPELMEDRRTRFDRQSAGASAWLTTRAQRDLSPSTLRIVLPFMGAAQ